MSNFICRQCSIIAVGALATSQAAANPVQDCACGPAGLYDISGQAVHCDGSGYALIQSIVSGKCRLEAIDDNRLTEGYGASLVVKPDACGYLVSSAVHALAQYASGVKLEDIGRGSAESADDLAVQALRTYDNWHNGAKWTTTGDWCFQDQGCTSKASVWPNMYDSCASDQCVRWLTPKWAAFHSKDGHRPPVGSRTWLKMRDASTVCPTEVPTGEPTSLPTEEPTFAPTLLPTEAPTSEPTMVPSVPAPAVMNAASLHELFLQLNAGNVPPPDPAVAAKVIAALDTDGDGILSEAEQQAGNLQSVLDPTMIQGFAVADTNGDGLISVQESRRGGEEDMNLLQYSKLQLTEPEAGFDKADESDNNGLVSDIEYLSELRSTDAGRSATLEQSRGILAYGGGPTNFTFADGTSAEGLTLAQYEGLPPLATQHAFVGADADGDAAVTGGNLQDYLQLLASPKSMPDGVGADIIERLKGDAQGSLNFKEFADSDLTPALTREIAEGFADSDKDGDGKVSLEELKRVYSISDIELQELIVSKGLTAPFDYLDFATIMNAMKPPKKSSGPDNKADDSSLPPASKTSLGTGAILGIVFGILGCCLLLLLLLLCCCCCRKKQDPHGRRSTKDNSVPTDPVFGAPNDPFEEQNRDISPSEGGQTMQFPQKVLCGYAYSASLENSAASSFDCRGPSAGGSNGASPYASEQVVLASSSSELPHSAAPSVDFPSVDAKLDGADAVARPRAETKLRGRRQSISSMSLSYSTTQLGQSKRRLSLMNNNNPRYMQPTLSRTNSINASMNQQRALSRSPSPNLSRHSSVNALIRSRKSF